MKSNIARPDPIIFLKLAHFVRQLQIRSERYMHNSILNVSP